MSVSISLRIGGNGDFGISAKALYNRVIAEFKGENGVNGLRLQVQPWSWSSVEGILGLVSSRGEYGVYDLLEKNLRYCLSSGLRVLRKRWVSVSVDLRHLCAVWPRLRPTLV